MPLSDAPPVIVPLLVTVAVFPVTSIAEPPVPVVASPPSIVLSSSIVTFPPVTEIAGLPLSAPSLPLIVPAPPIVKSEFVVIAGLPIGAVRVSSS